MFANHHASAIWAGCRHKSRPWGWYSTSCSNGGISIPVGMVIGVVSILAYTLFGGMWSVAITDFIQMIILVGGLAVLACFAGNQAGGADKVIAFAMDKDLFRFWPERPSKTSSSSSPLPSP